LFVHIPEIVHPSAPDEANDFFPYDRHPGVVCGVEAEILEIELQFGAFHDLGRRGWCPLGQVNGPQEEFPQQGAFVGAEFPEDDRKGRGVVHFFPVFYRRGQLLSRHG